jgi:hypothetical protein
MSYRPADPVPMIDKPFAHCMTESIKEIVPWKIASA